MANTIIRTPTSIIKRYWEFGGVQVVLRAFFLAILTDCQTERGGKIVLTYSKYFVDYIESEVDKYLTHRTIENDSHDSRYSDLSSTAIGVTCPELPFALQRVGRTMMGSRFAFKSPVVISGTIRPSKASSFLVSLTDVTSVVLIEPEKDPLLIFGASAE